MFKIIIYLMSIFSCKNLLSPIKKYKQSKRYLEIKYKEIRKGYYNKFVALFDRQIIGTSSGGIKKLMHSFCMDNKNPSSAHMKLISQSIPLNIL